MTPIDLEPFREHANLYLADDGEGSTRGERELATDVLVLAHDIEELQARLKIWEPPF